MFNTNLFPILYKVIKHLQYISYSLQVVVSHYQPLCCSSCKILKHYQPISYSLQDLKTLPTNFLFSTRYSETTNLFPISYSEQYFSFSIIVSWLQTMEPDWPEYFGKIERIYFRSNIWKFFQGCWKFTTFKEFYRVLETSKV